MDKKVLKYWGENYWGHPVYQLQGEEKYYADLGNQYQHDLHTLSPINDPDGEPDMPINPEKFTIIPKPKESKKSREEQKFILAKMIAANEYQEGTTSIEWVDLASSIKDINLTKELLKELKEQPMELKFISGHGWLEKEQAEALEVLNHYQLDSADKKFRYQMLSRMQSDCEYYLGYGNHSRNRLWAHDETKQIKIMKAFYQSFHDWEKPEWISMEDILNYENEMLYPLVIDGKRMQILVSFFKEEKYLIAEDKDQEMYAFYNLKSDGTYERKHECVEVAPSLYKIGKEIKPSVKIKLNNDMTMVLDNQNGEGICIASLIDTDGAILSVKIIDEQKLFQFLCSQKDASREVLKKFYTIAASVRNEMEDTYGEDLQGKCMEASECIAKRISEELRIESKTVEGWCRFDNEDSGSDHPWDPHTWVEIPLLNLYIDITADQFNCGMYDDYPKILVQKGLPHGMQYEEPSWDDFNRD